MEHWVEVLKRNRLKGLGAVVVLLLGGSLVWSLCVPHTDVRVEAIRKKGYPVTLAELDAWYPAVPPAENAALVYTNAFALLAADSGLNTGASFMASTWPLRGQGLTAEDKRGLAELLATNQAALGLLYAAPASGRSRYPIDLREWPTAQLTQLAGVKGAVMLLTTEALLHASDGDGQKATQALLAAGRVADSLSEEPLLISHLVRVAAWKIVLTRLERVLGLTQLTDEQLGLLQESVGDAERPQGLVRSLVGEQAIGIAIYFDRENQDAAFSTGQQSPSGKGGTFRMGLFFFGLYRATGLFQKDKAYYLDAMGKQIAAAELPYPARFTASGQAAAALTNPPSRFCIISRMMLPALSRVHGRDAESAARIRAATAALAVERFRRARGNALPDNLQALAPTYLPAVPADPFAGKPLRFTRHGASYAVYCGGSDGKDDGGVDWNSLKLKNPSAVVFVVEH
ncbi:MAG: hypothetical protein ABSF95_04670 [Verrucomicrobiota bacterium]